jgi:cytochrome P450
MIGLSAPLPGIARRAYFPFGLGPRACIGALVALTEATLIVAAPWRRYRLALPAGTEVRPRPALALPPAGARFTVLPP